MEIESDNEISNQEYIDFVIGGGGPDLSSHEKSATCDICGNPATHRCSRVGPLNCWSVLCENPSCTLIHLYMSHPNLMSQICGLEKAMNAEPAKILVGRMASRHEEGEIYYKAGFLIPYREGGFIWTTISVHRTLNDLEDALNEKLSNTDGREVIYTEEFHTSKIPPGTLDKLIS